MKATSIDTNANPHDNNVHDDPATHGQTMPSGNAEPSAATGKAESELRAAARRHGLTLKQLAARMGVSYGYLSSVSAGRRPWFPMLRERAMVVLGEVPGQGVVYRRGGLVKGESSYVRERARERGMSLMGPSERAGVSYGYLCQVSRGQRNMGPAVQVRVEAALDGPVRIESAQLPSVDPHVLWERMDVLGISQNETARRAGISSAYLSNIMNGQRTPSGDVLRRLHDVLFRPTAAELVVPAEVKVLVFPGRRADATAWWCAAPVDPTAVATGTAAPSASAAGCPGARKSSTLTLPATTAGDGSR